MSPTVTRFIAKGAIILTLSLALGCSARSAAARADHSVWELSQGGLATGPELARLERLTHSLLRPHFLTPAPSAAKPTDLYVGSRLPAPFIRIALLQTSEPSAYSFPDGHLYVSHGLCALLDDPELTAAIAHEIGHLANDGHYPQPHSTPLAASHLHTSRRDTRNRTGRTAICEASAPVASNRCLSPNPCHAHSEAPRYALRGTPSTTLPSDPESAADATGVQFLRAARLDPAAMPRMLHRLAQAQTSATVRAQILSRATRLQTR